MEKLFIVPTEMKNFKKVFQDYCESTSLHGYSYLFISSSLIGKIFFALIIIIFTSVGMFFLGLNFDQYKKSTTNIKIETTTAPLSEAVFPSVTVCNFNQLEASYLRKYEVDDLKLKEILIKKYIIGHKENLTEEEELLFQTVQNSTGDYVSWYGRQWCRNLFINTRFEDRELAWNDFPEEDDWIIGPYQYATDLGQCCFLSPHINTLPDMFSTNYHELKAPAKHGKAFQLLYISRVGPIFRIGCSSEFYKHFFLSPQFHPSLIFIPV